MQTLFLFNSAQKPVFGKMEKKKAKTVHADGFRFSDSVVFGKFIIEIYTF